MDCFFVYVQGSLFRSCSSVICYIGYHFFHLISFLMFFLLPFSFLPLFDFYFLFILILYHHILLPFLFHLSSSTTISPCPSTVPCSYLAIITRTMTPTTTTTTTSSTTTTITTTATMRQLPPITESKSLC